MEREFEKGGAIIYAMTIAASAVNYLFQIFAARVLSVESYGALNFLLSIVSMLSVFGVAVSARVTIDTAKGSVPIAAILKRSVLLVTIINIALLVLITAAPNSRYAYFAMAILVTQLGGYLSIAVGMGQGLRIYAVISGGHIIIALFKLLGVFFSLHFEDSLLFILFSFLVGAVAAVVFSFVLLRRAKPELSFRQIASSNMREYAISYKYIIKAVLLNILMMFMLNADILLIKWLHSDYTVGAYSPAMNFGRILYFACTSISAALFTFAARRKAQGKQSLPIYIKSLIFVSIISVIFISFVGIFGGDIIIMLFGDKYAHSAQYLLYANLLNTGITLCSITMNYLLAIDKLNVMIKILCVIALISTISAGAFNDIKQLLIMLTVLFFMGFAANFIYICKYSKREEAYL